MAKKVTDTAVVVKKILETNPRSRDDDNLLICFVYDYYGYNWHMEFCQIMKAISEKKIPTLETITRCRRKCIELYPHLSASTSVQTNRINNTANYIKFAQDKRI